LPAFDAGFASYMAALHMEHRYNHPGVIVFGDLLRDHLAYRRAEARLRSIVRGSAMLGRVIHEHFPARPAARWQWAAHQAWLALRSARALRQRIRNRWHLAVFLLFNPSVRQYRKHARHLLDPNPEIAVDKFQAAERAAAVTLEAARVRRTEALSTAAALYAQTMPSNGFSTAHARRRHVCAMSYGDTSAAVECARGIAHVYTGIRPDSLREDAVLTSTTTLRDELRKERAEVAQLRELTMLQTTKLKELQRELYKLGTMQTHGHQAQLPVTEPATATASTTTAYGAQACAAGAPDGVMLTALSRPTVMDAMLQRESLASAFAADDDNDDVADELKC